MSLCVRFFLLLRRWRLCHAAVLDMQVNQPHVQLAVARTLVNDPNFQKLLRDENKVDDTVFYPVAARTGFEVTVRPMPHPRQIAFSV